MKYLFLFIFFSCSHRVLVTGFEPISNNSINVTQTIIWENSPEHYIILPVSWSAHKLLSKKIEEVKPDYILILGESDREPVRVEMTAHNITNGIVDNYGIVRSGKIDRFSSESLTTTVKSDFPNKSYDAGKYICNYIYFQTLLHHPDIPTILVHIPKSQKSLNLSKFYYR